MMHGGDRVDQANIWSSPRADREMERGAVTPTFVVLLTGIGQDKWDKPTPRARFVYIEAFHCILYCIFVSLWRGWYVGIPSYVHKNLETLWDWDQG